MTLHSNGLFRFWRRQAPSTMLYITCFAFLVRKQKRTFSVLRLILLGTLRKDTDIKTRLNYDVYPQISYRVENLNMVMVLYFSPGRSTVDGKCGLFGESGKC